MAQNLATARLNVNLPLTNLAQGFVAPQYVMRLLFPLVEVPTYGGQIIQFDDSMYEDVVDDRADDTPYPEISSGYDGRPFKLKTKGLSYRVGDKRRKEMENLRINWGQIARDMLMARAGLRHEINAAVVAGTVGNYATSNRISLGAGQGFNVPAVDPDPIIRTAKSAIADQIGVEPNVMVMSRDAYDTLATRYSRNFTATDGGIKAQLSLETLAGIFGFQRAAICDAIVKNQSGVKSKVLQNKIIIAYANPAGLTGTALPYRPTGEINAMVPAYGYTYVMQGNPLMYTPYYDNDRGATVYKLDFDNVVAPTGVDAGGLFTHGYLINNVVTALA